MCLHWGFLCRNGKLLGFEGCDASVHRWRRSDATGAAAIEPEGLRRQGNPVRVIEVYIDELDLAVLGFEVFKKIADFRKDNDTAIRWVCRLCPGLKLFTAPLHASGKTQQSTRHL
jgi:hypothetical protein